METRNETQENTMQAQYREWYEDKYGDETEPITMPEGAGIPVNDALADTKGQLLSDLQTALTPDIKKAIACFCVLDKALKGINETFKQEKYRDFIGESKQYRDILQAFYTVAQCHNNLKYHLGRLADMAKALAGGGQ